MLSATRFTGAFNRLGVDPPAGLAEQLLAAYSEPHRHYHNAVHIAECLRLLDINRDDADRLEEIEIAIWFHDAVYQTRNADNEEASAAWAERSLSAAGTDKGATSRVVEMILATKHHAGASNDQRLLLDIDLSILGAEPDVFAAYNEAIRKEYSWVPEGDYRAGRAKVLRSFSDRPHIYETLRFRSSYERKARENINAALARLGSLRTGLDRESQA